ncbi:MAG TPA: zinc ABC transporter substrate-binding protein [Opitutaceae bacterium]|nr:zinc ABC transporter substrate-binding protein [Opitutaceae bacterium]
MRKPISRCLGSCLARVLFAAASIVGFADAAPLRVVATTGMVADLVRQVGGERIEVDGLMGAGVDPHLYKASAQDVVRLQRADVIFYNGLLLEGKMGDLLTRMARSKKGGVYAVTESIPEELLLSPAEFSGHHDPHLWLDVSLWARCGDTVAEALTAEDPEGAAYYKSRAEQSRASLAELHVWALAKAAELPQERRILITSHDAFNYFGRAYGFEVVGLQGISTVTEAGLADMARMVDLIKARGARAIFVESSVPPQAIQRIAADAGVRVGGELFSDAMGTPGEIEHGYDLGTYNGMIRHNLNTVVEALR